MSEKSDEEYIYGVESMHTKEKVPRGEKVHPSPVDGRDSHGEGKKNHERNKRLKEEGSKERKVREERRKGREIESSIL